MLCENLDCACERKADLVQDGRHFCSQHCLAEGNEGASCRCGHAACSTAAAGRAAGGPGRVRAAVDERMRAVASGTEGGEP
jgi:hypothetical protein